MSEFYFYVWVIYGVAALGTLLIAWLLLRHIRVPALGPALFAWCAALLLTPAKVIPQQDDFSPALMVALFDGLTMGWAGAWPGLKPILLVYAVLLLLLLAGYALRLAVVGRTKKVPADQSAEHESEHFADDDPDSLRALR